MRAWLVSLPIALALAGGAHAQSQTTLLHDALHLSAAQEDAWKVYQRAMADPDEEARARQTRMMLPTLPTPRRLALIRAQMEADLVSFDRRSRVVEGFYAGLSPEQQRVYDRQTGASEQAGR